MEIYELSISDFVNNSTNLFVNTVQKSFIEVTRSSIRECMKCTAKFNPDRSETGRKSFPLTEKQLEHC